MEKYILRRRRNIVVHFKVSRKSSTRSTSDSTAYLWGKNDNVIILEVKIPPNLQKLAGIGISSSRNREMVKSHVSDKFKLMLIMMQQREHRGWSKVEE